MDFDFSEEQLGIRNLAREMLEAEVSLEHLKEIEASDAFSSCCQALSSGAQRPVALNSDSSVSVVRSSSMGRPVGMGSSNWASASV